MNEPPVYRIMLCWRVRLTLVHDGAWLWDTISGFKPREVVLVTHARCSLEHHEGLRSIDRRMPVRWVRSIYALFQRLRRYKAARLEIEVDYLSCGSGVDCAWACCLLQERSRGDIGTSWQIPLIRVSKPLASGQCFMTRAYLTSAAVGSVLIG